MKKQKNIGKSIIERTISGELQMKNKIIKILFIGNSHTYYNDMPSLVKKRLDEKGYDCHVTMLAHPGWFLTQQWKIRKQSSTFSSVGMIMWFCRSTPIPLALRRSSLMLFEH